MSEKEEDPVPALSAGICAGHRRCDRANTSYASSTRRNEECSLVVGKTNLFPDRGTISVGINGAVDALSKTSTSSTRRPLPVPSLNLSSIQNSRHVRSLFVLLTRLLDCSQLYERYERYTMVVYHVCTE